jgi:hypothetical protein
MLEAALLASVQWSFSSTRISHVFNSQHNLFADDGLKSDGLVSRNRMPVLDLSCIDETSTFADGQYYNRQRVLRVKGLVCWDGSNASRPDLVIQVSGSGNPPRKFLAHAADLFQNGARGRTGGDQDTVSHVLQVI